MELNLRYGLQEVVKDGNEVLKECFEDQIVETHVMLVSKKLVKDYSR